MDRARGIPPGILLISNIRGRNWSLRTYKNMVLIITFIAYTSYHASRKPSSIVKSVLDPESNSHHSRKEKPWPIGNVFIKEDFVDRFGDEKGWEPFNRTDGRHKLGEIDLAFLSCYSMGMYVAGHLGDKLDLRLFLTTGMIGSGIFVALFGMGYYLNIHVFGYFLVMQMAAGLFQATGWPSVVAVIGNWFGKRKRGLIMGIWNAHTSIGNISGSLIAASALDYNWGLSFIAPGTLIAGAGILVYLFLAAYPEDVGFTSPDLLSDSGKVNSDVEARRQQQNVIAGKQDRASSRQASAFKRGVGLLEACWIPGVIPFALCLFFSKLVAYTFLYWLPFYLSQTEIGGQQMSTKSAGNLSTLFDVGGIVGGILAGYISDRLRARAITAASFMIASIPSMVLYNFYGGVSQTMNIVLMMITGLFINGPYALITTAVSADLGTHSSLRGDARALATVTAIIDGTGSIGAAFGPLLTGFLSTLGWDWVFGMLVACALIAALLLSHQIRSEITDISGKLLSSSRGWQINEASESQPLLRDHR